MKKLAVIKAGSAAKLEAMGLRAFHFSDVTHEARKLLESVRAQSEGVVAAAREEADRIRREAEAVRQSAKRDSEAIREAARHDGFRVGQEAAAQQWLAQGRGEVLAVAQREFEQSQAELLAAFRAIMDAVEQGRAAWLSAARQDLIELAVAIARRVVGHVGQRDREVVLANLQEAVRLVGLRSDVTIAVNPADAQAARVFAKSLLDLKEHWQNINVVEESEVSPGGCRVQWGSGSVDAALETQLDRIEAELKGE